MNEKRAFWLMVGLGLFAIVVNFSNLVFQENSLANVDTGPQVAAVADSSRPTAVLTLNKTTLTEDDRLTISWRATNVQFCDIAGHADFNGSVGPSGSKTFSLAAGTYKFYLDCYGSAGLVLDQKTVTVTKAVVDDTPDTPPVGDVVGQNNDTLCINSDGPSGKSAYDIFQDVKAFGPGAVEAPKNHPLSHISEGVDSIIGNYFVFLIHKTDNDRNGKNDRSRIEVKGPTGQKNETYTFTWRFFIPANYKFSSRFTHFHQIKADDGDESNPAISIGGRVDGSGNEWLEIDNLDSDSSNTSLGKVSMSGLKGVWLDVYEQATYGTNGSYELKIKKPDGSIAFQTKQNTVLWRSGRVSMRPKWGVYRGHPDPNNLNEEDQVGFANFGITKGATPTSDCRPATTAAPVITSITPNSLKVGDRFTIRGSGFVPGQEYVIYENGFNAALVRAVSNTELAPAPLLAVTIMSYGPNNKIAVSGAGKRSNDFNFTLLRP